MKFPWSKKSKPTQIESKSATYDIDSSSFLAYAFGYGTRWVTDRQAKVFYQQTSAVATSVDMIADSINQIQPVIRTKNGEFLEDHPVIDLLKKPNGFSDWILFMGTLARNYLLKHDSLVTAPGNVKFPPLEIWPEPLMNMSIIEGNDGYPKKYIVSKGVLKGNYIRTENRQAKQARFYDGRARELFHIRGYTTRYNNLESDSPLQAAALEARQLIQGKYHNVKLLENGARLSLLVTFHDEDEIDDDEHKRRVKRLNEQYAGSQNTGKIGVISGADIQHIKEFGRSNKDMDFANLETLAGQAVYLRYQIPLSLVSNEASTFDNMKTGIELLYDNAVLPNANVLFSGLTWFLLPRFGMDPTKEAITYNPESIEPLKRRKLDEINVRKKANIETVNELRKLLPEREPLPGGDDLYQNKNLIPMQSKPEENNDGQSSEEATNTEATNTEEA